MSKKILFVASELAPFSKVGGLGDVVGSLPSALCKAGADVRVLTPAYNVLDKVRKAGNSLKKLECPVVVAIGGVPVYCAIYETKIDGVITWFLEAPEFFGAEIYPDFVSAQTVLPFAALSLAALEVHRATDWKPDVFHCHDWPTATLPIALAWHEHYRQMHEGAKSVFTIHNLAHQGVFSPQDFFQQTGIASTSFNPAGVEYYGSVNLLKGAIVASNHVTTVSPTYAGEIQTPIGGANLDGVLRQNSHKLSGILNGLDTDYWNPATDTNIAAPYSSSNLQGKLKDRAVLHDKCLWKDDGRPVVVCVSRLVDQKGFDLILSAMPEIAASSARYVFLGTGSPDIEEGLLFAQSVHQDEVRFFKGYDEKLAHLLYAGGDIFLMPSLFEPCGLSQLISMRYGTVPVARGVGGLVDTVIEGENGFLFWDYTKESMMEAMRRAIEAHADKAMWNKLVMHGMQADFTWKRSALSYLDIYNS